MNTVPKSKVASQPWADANPKDVDFDFIQSILRVTPIDDEYYIVHGNNIVSRNKFTYIGDAWDYVKTKPWEIIVYLASFAAQNAVNNLNTENK